MTAKLIGKWIRPDGGYILEIKSIGSNGILEAAYFNPSPIRVSTARVEQLDGTIKVFVELRDTGYSGCTYNLIYDSTEDKLKGLYFQATQQQIYEIFFDRLK
jgi:hypothetical protein